MSHVHWDITIESQGYLIRPAGEYLKLGERQNPEIFFSLSGFQVADLHVFLHLTGTVTQESHSLVGVWCFGARAGCLKIPQDNRNVTVTTPFLWNMVSSMLEFLIAFS